MSRGSARAFAPASIGNVAVGFDLLGHSLAGPGDTATVRIIDEPVVRVAAVRGIAGPLPLDAEKNTAGRALMALREGLALGHGFELELDKGIALGSGMGGSAASCVAALVAASALLEAPPPREALYPFALEGEAVASGGRHGDNLGAMLLGGLVLATADRLVRLRVPGAWHCVLVHPEQVLETRRAREALAGSYALSNFVAQSANLALVLTGCANGDAALVRAGLADVLVEPRRAALIPGFAAVKQAALQHGAMGASISGAGPSVFAWFETRAAAEAAAAPMQAAFAAIGVDSQAWVSPVDGPRAELIDAPRPEAPAGAPASRASIDREGESSETSRPAAPAGAAANRAPIDRGGESDGTTRPRAPGVTGASNDTIARHDDERGSVA